MGENGEPQLLDWFDHFGFATVSDCGAVKTEIGLLSEVPGCSGTFTRTYQFRATDERGNTSYVTATFAIVDTTPPLITSCPQSDVLLTCEFDIPGPDMHGVMAMDMCSDVTVTLQSTTINGIGCAYSPLTKTYTYAFTDACGNVSTCTQTFVVIDTIQPSYTGPDTLYVLCVADLPGVGDLDDVLAPYFVDNCYKNLCVGELLAGNDLNSVTFNVYFKDLCANWADKDTVTFIANDGCKPLCSAPQDVWGNTAGLINGLGTTALIEQLMNKHGALIAGKLNKTISVSSAACLQNMLPGSGNTNQFSPIHYTFTAANACNLSSPLLNSDGTLKHKLAANVFAMQLNIWYNAAFNDRNLGVQLLASVPAALIDPIILTKLEVQHFNVQGLLNLSNDYLAGVGFFPPNFGSPLNSALENLNNYWQNCQTNAPTSGNVSVAGTLKTAELDGLENALVHFEGLGNEGTLAGAIALSNEAGSYEFSNAVPMFGNYTVTPSSENMAHQNGVSTYDLLLISKHILGITPFDSPYKMIAADVNNSGSITTLDIVEASKMILGIYEAFPDNTAWRFIDKAFVFPNTLNPFSTTFPEYKTLENMQASQMSDDFVGVKIGDVNGSAQANTLMSIPDRNTGTLLFDLEERSVQAGEIFDVTFKSDQIVQGYQFTLNTPGLEILEVSGNEAVASNFAVFDADAALTSSWNLPAGATAQTTEFTLKVQTTKSGRLSEMLRLSNRITQSEAYRNDNNGSKDPIMLSIALRFHDAAGTTISSNGFELYQNIPNPFVDQTTIGFYLPESTEAVLTVYDETGRLVYTQRGDFYKGYNTFSINQSLLGTNGALLYKVATSTDIGIMKMIQTK